METTKKRLVHIEMNLKLEVSKLNFNIIKEWKNLNLCDYDIYLKVPSIKIDEYCNVLSYIENAMPDEPGNQEVVVEANEVINEEDTISVVIKEEGSIIGISRVFIDNDDPTKLYQAQIGVIKGYTGKGYGKFLMGLTYSYIFENYKLLDSMTVDTHPTNKPMIKILENLGYEYTHTENIYI